MQFVFPSLAWGFLLMLVPLAIHLIQWTRHRQVPWAAMEFLLESYRKHQRWVWMKQLLLLLSRIAIMATLAAMCAQWISNARWASLFGQSVTHHLLLVDDSFSMSDTQKGASAYQKAWDAVGVLLRNAAAAGGNHHATVLRYSQAQATGPVQTTGQYQSIDARADVLAASVPSDPTPLLEAIRSTRPTSLELSPLAGLQLLQQVPRIAMDEQRIVYVVSDFRRKDWGSPEAIQPAIAAVAAEGTRIELIDCVDEEHPNLSIESVTADSDILAAGIPAKVRVQVRNSGPSVARDVQVRLQAIDSAEAGSAPRLSDPYSGKVQDVPPELIDRLGPGESTALSFQVVFPSSGYHGLHAMLADDAIETDNHGYSVLAMDQGKQVLVIDGDPKQQNGFFLEAALEPGGPARTGLRTVRKEPAWLRDAASEDLDPYAAIFLLGCPRLDVAAVANVESYVQRGGGVAVVLGSEEATLLDYQAADRGWYRDGEGFLPVRPLDAVALEGERAPGGADMSIEAHAIFQSLLALNSNPLGMIRISQRVAIDPQKPLPAQARVIATSRDKQPLMIDSPLGAGRVLTYLGGWTNAWSNWQRDPTFVITSLKMAAYLGSFRQAESSQSILEPLAWRGNSLQYAPNYQVVFPAIGAGGRVAVEGEAKSGEEGQLSIDIQPGDPSLSPSVALASTHPGIVELWLQTLEGQPQMRTFAKQVSAGEGSTLKVTPEELQEGLRPVAIQYRKADAIQANNALEASASRRSSWWILLLALLALEQFFGWWSSYHIPKRSAKGAS
jgi:hypothetical protein